MFTPTPVAAFWKRRKIAAFTLCLFYLKEAKDCSEILRGVLLCDRVRAMGALMHVVIIILAA